MANTVTVGANLVSVVPDGSTAFDLATIYPFKDGINLRAIIFQPSAANDVLQVRDKNASGATIWPGNKDVSGGGQVIYYDGKSYRPYIVQTAECTFGTPANVKIVFLGDPVTRP